MESTTGFAADSVTKVCRSGQVSDTVIDAVAAAKDVDPLDLEPLYDVVDPDALNGLFEPTIGRPPADMELTFSMADCEVVVRGDGEVIVTPDSVDAKSRRTVAPTEN